MVEEDCILCGNGASELIQAIVQALQPKKALLLAPGFSGYTKALESVDCEIVLWKLLEENHFQPKEDLFTVIERVRPELLFFANPSNPTGVVAKREYLENLLRVCEKTGTVLVIDECFWQLSNAPDVFTMEREVLGHKKLLLLRAFTKSVAIPGVRLGYLLCSTKEMAERIGKVLPEWNVSGLAQAAGVAALEEMEYLEESRKVIRKERTYLWEELSALGFHVIPSEANFLLFHLGKTESFFKAQEKSLYEFLLEKGILIRDCSDYAGLSQGYYRIGVKSHEKNEKLIAYIKELVESDEDSQ